MSISHKSSLTQIFRMMIYNRALHPELFDVRIRRNCRYDEYEAEIWLANPGHVVRFQVEGHCLTETVLDHSDHLPETGLIHALPCFGEKEYEMSPQDGLGYVTTVQTELLTDNLYMATMREMRDSAVESNAVVHEWKEDDGAPCLSMLDIQHYRREFHIQSYHLLGSLDLVLRTQSIFEIL